MQHLPYADNAFDFVTNIGGLEHVPDMEVALREMARVCADEGRICIVVPNVDFFWYKVLSLEGTQQSAMEEHPLTLDEWQDLIRGAGLSILQVEADPGPDIRTDFGPKVFLRGVFRRAALVFTALLPITSTYQFVFVCGKFRIRS
jgi:SAM-dependent methyltransferase